VKKKPLWPDDLEPLPAAKIKQSIINNAGARPWDRDPIDERIIRAAVQGKGRIIDSQQQVGGYPNPTATRAPFNPDLWNLNTMQRRRDQAVGIDR
jgi:hypothetical protein